MYIFLGGSYIYKYMLIYLFEDHFTVKVFTAMRRLKGGSEVSQKPFRTCSFEDM